ncbi:MAG: hypothetical protein ACREJO_00355 [Phycisphaerales bacterium]
MGVLTDFVVAKESEAAEVAHAHADNPKWRRWDCKGIDHILLAGLYEVLTDRPADEAVEDLEQIAEGGDDGPWVYLVPREWVEAIAAIDDDHMGAASRAWALRGEWTERGEPEPDLSEYVKLLREASRAARDSNQSLLMWMCL